MYRYWDGLQWTEHRSPKAVPAPPSPLPIPLPKRKPQSERFAALPTIVKVGILGLFLLAVLVYAFVFYYDNNGSSGSGSNACETVAYRVTGTADSVSITMEGADGGTEQRDPVSLPFSSFPCFSPREFTYLSAQNNGEFGTVERKIVRGDVVVSEASSSGAYVIATRSD
jgi:hypothetical protein